MTKEIIFLVFTKVDPSREVYVSIEKIKFFETEGSGTFITFDGNLGLHVKETLEEVKRRMQGL